VNNRLFAQLLTVTGTVEPTTVAGLASPAEGPVLGCRVREGDRVTAGQELLRIGRQLSAEAAQASAREELRRQEQEFRRITTLVTEKAVAGDQLDTARAALERARAALAQAEQAADDYSIRAPWAGVVSRVRVADGNYVSPRTPLVDLYDPTSLVLRFAVPEDHAFALMAGGRVQATFDALPGRAFTLEIIRAYPELDRRLRTRSFEAALSADATFAPGMFARIRAVLDEQQAAVTIPVEAVLGDGMKQFVFVLADGKALRRPVETGFEQDGRVWIRTGLKVGDRVIIGGIERVKDGATVRLEGSGPAVKAEGDKTAAKAARS
jgi:membrane fusion protein (multidrug efflux system)